MKRIAVVTSGGDCPGLNACIRAIVRYSLSKRLEVYGVKRGYKGLTEGEVFKMGRGDVSNIIQLGGTILKTARCEDFHKISQQKKAYQTLLKQEIDGLIIIGGDGSLKGANALYKNFLAANPKDTASKFHKNIRCIGIPKTIDNDVAGTDICIGFDTAVNTALDAIDKIRDTATSLERIFVVEVMGRYNGFLALYSALAGGAEDVLVPEHKIDIKIVCEQIKKGRQKGKKSWIIVVAEGAAKGEEVAQIITKQIGCDVRVTVLGHTQRGGSPTAWDRIIATRFGIKAVDALLDGKTGCFVGIRNNRMVLVPFENKERLRLDEKLYNIVDVLAQ
jgi:6-phosphofructokinase 1